MHRCIGIRISYTELLAGLKECSCKSHWCGLVMHSASRLSLSPLPPSHSRQKNKTSAGCRQRDNLLHHVQSLLCGSKLGCNCTAKIPKKNITPLMKAFSTCGWTLIILHFNWGATALLCLEKFSFLKGPDLIGPMKAEFTNMCQFQVVCLMLSAKALISHDVSLGLPPARSHGLTLPMWPW